MTKKSDRTTVIAPESGFDHNKGKVLKVEPLRTKIEIDAFRDALKTVSRPDKVQRNLLLFSIGINTGLRIGDILALNIEDVYGRSSVTIREGKTKKPRKVYLYAVMADIADYIDTLDHKTGKLFPFSYVQAYRILQQAAESLGFDYIGTHTLRKSFGFHYYQATKDIAALQEILNHSSPTVTKRYIGITDQQIGDSLRDFRL